MDFVQGIGERYLMGKANAAPQMLENIAKKQFASASDPKALATQASALPTTEKDEEIAKLRKELAETRLQKDKASGDTKTAKSKIGASSVRSTVAEKTRATASENRSGGSSAKATAGREMKGSAPLSTSGEGRSVATKQKKAFESTRGRRASTSTATAAKAHKAPSEANSGGRPSNPGTLPRLQGLEAVGGKEALQGNMNVRKAAASAYSAHAWSTNRRHLMAQKSESGSEDGSSEAVTATRPPSLPPQGSMHHAERERAQVYEQVVRRPKEAYEVEEPDLYVIEVEEDVSRRKKSTKYLAGQGGVVEVQHSKGRTVYRVT